MKLSKKIRHTAKDAWFDAIDWVRYWLGAETRDEAWSDGYNHGEEEWEDTLEQKDAFIAEQSALIAQLDEWVWQSGYNDQLPPAIEEKLRDYR